MVNSAPRGGSGPKKWLPFGLGSPEDGSVNPSDVRLVIVTGMSGAGRSRALAALEDFGYFCIDNLPPSMIPQVSNLMLLQDSHIEKMGVACDIRSGKHFESLLQVLDHPDEIGVGHVLMFLDADDEVLINRFKETRRPHPLADAADSLIGAIELERSMIGPVRDRADLVIDTSELRASELRARIQEEFRDASLGSPLSVSVSSFGFKYGAPGDADIVFDVRFLPNPFYDPELKPLSGLDSAVRDYVLGRKETQRFMRRWQPLLESVVPAYQAEGKTHLSIALGCTGGRHRSVALAEATAEWLREKGYRTSVSHRDLNRDQEH